MKMAQKAVLNVPAMNDEKTKQKALKAAAGVCGVESIEAIVKHQKLTVVGRMDIVALAKKLEEVGKVGITLVVPAKEEKKDDKKDAGSKKHGDDKKSDNQLTMQLKAVLNVQAMNDEKTKKKAVKAAADVCGVESIEAIVKHQKLTVVGRMDIVALAEKLKKVGKVGITLVVPAKEEKKDDKKDAGSKKHGDDKKSDNQLTMQLKAVLNVQAMNDEKTKQKAMKAAAGVCGVESIEAIVKHEKLTVVGRMDIVALAEKLKKVGKVGITLVVPAKEEKKDDAGSKKDGDDKKSDNQLTMQLKAVLNVQAMNDEKTRQKAMKTAPGVCGVESVEGNVKHQKLTVVGWMDILAVVKKLEKKVGKVGIILVVPAKEEKKDDKKYAGRKKDRDDKKSDKQLTMQLKAVLNVQAMNDEKTKQKAVKAAAGVCGVELKAANVKVQKLTVMEQMDIGAVAKKPEEVGKVGIKWVVPAKEEKKDAGSKKDGGGGGKKSDKTSKKK